MAAIRKTGCWSSIPSRRDDHIHPIELRDEKFLRAPNNDGEMQRLVDSVARQVAQLSTPLADIRPLTAPNWYGTTPVGSTRFVGRLKEMWEVHSLLHAGDVAQITGAAAATGGIGQVQGLGGVGKSLLAEEYALHFGAAYPGGVFWVRAYGNDDAKAALGATEREALRADQVRGLAERLGIDAHGKTGEEIEGALARKIADEGKDCLWVVDDVPNGLNGEALRRWFAPHALARTLVTTRSREYGALAKGIDLSVLTPDEALQLLTSRRKPAGKDEEEQARGLAKDLGYHALALDVTASALVSSVAAKPFGDFRAKLAGPDKDALELAKDLADALPTGHEPSIAKTMLGSIRGLGSGRAGLPAAGVGAGGGARFRRRWLRRSSRKRTSSAARMRRGARAWRSSRLPRHPWRRRRMSSRMRARCIRWCRGRCASMRKPRPSARRRCGRRRSRRCGRRSPKRRRTRGCTSRLSSTWRTRGRWSRCRTTCPRPISWAGWRDMTTSEGRMRRRGRYASASLSSAAVSRGPSTRDTLTSMSNLASALREQGDLAGARKLQEETLAIQRRVLGPEHPDTLNSMNNLGDTRAGAGRPGRGA